VPEKKVAYFQESFGGRYVKIEGISVPKKPLEDFLQLVSLSVVGVENHIVRGWKTQKRYVRYYTARAVHTIFGRFFFLHKFFRFIARIYLHTKVFDLLFEAYKPDIVFTTDSFYREDRALLVEAKRKTIPTVGMIRSWDNTTTKGVLLAEPDHIIVPNGVLEEELVSIHHIPSDKITVTGIPHYDTTTTTGVISKEQFFKKTGLDPKKKIVFFSPGGSILYKHDGEVLALLKKHIDAGNFGYPVQVIVSFPPADTIDTSSIENDKNFIIIDNGSNVTGRKKDSELSIDDNKLINSNLYYSDVVVTLASTIAIDGMAFGKPVIIFGFDPQEGLPDRVEKFTKYKHLEKFLGSGLITISHNEDEFAQHINTYLKDPSYDKDKRERLVSRYVHKLDGCSSKRVADYLIRRLEVK